MPDTVADVLVRLGVDTDTVLRFKVEKRGKEFWATWGRKSAS